MRLPTASARQTKRAWLWAALAVAATLLVLGEVVFLRVRRVGWTAYSAETSPLRGRVQDIAVGMDGVLWVGTDAGLFRFDGASWRAYTPADGLPDWDVRALAVAPDGGLWAYTAQGSFRFDGQTWHRYRLLDLWLEYWDTSAEPARRPLAVASDGTLWGGTKEGLLRFCEHLTVTSGTSIWSTYDSPDGLSGGEILAIAVDPDDAVWVGTRRGIARFDGENWTAYTRRDGFPGGRVRAVAVSADGTVWAGTGGGLARFDGRAWKVVPYGGPGRAGSVVALAVDDRGHVWAGARGGVGVWDVEANTWLWAASLWHTARVPLILGTLTLSVYLFGTSPWRARLVAALAAWVQRRRPWIERVSPGTRFRRWVDRQAAAYARFRSDVVRDLSEQRALWIALSVVVLATLFLRLWRLDFGKMLPYVAHADEHTQYNPAIHIIQTGDLNPHFFNYPSLTIYVDAVVLYAGYLVGALVGAFDTVADLQTIEAAGYGRGMVGTPGMLLLGRATTAVFGALTIVLAFALARQLCRRRWLSLAVAALLSVSGMHVRLSHYMTVDVIATFFATACILGCTLYLVKRQTGYLWLAAVCGGLATSAKYNYAVLSVPVALSVLLDPRLWSHEQLKRVWTCGVLFCLAFVLTSPYVLLDLPAASEDIGYEMRHYATGHLGQTGNSFARYLETVWRENPSYLLLGVPGLVAALWYRRPAAWPAAIFCLVYYVLLGVQTTHMGRNVLPVLVLLVVGVGSALDALVERLPRQVRAWRIAAKGVEVLPVVAVLACVPLLPALPTLSAILRLPAPSGQAQAQAWFDRALETQDGQQALGALRIAAEGYTIYLDRRQYEITYLDTVSKVGPPAVFAEQGYDLVLLGSGMYGRFYDNPDVFAEEVGVYDAFFESDLERMVFEQESDPLDFVGGGAKVYVFILSDEAFSR
jgi:4-amino-4-deoxy-L-arabinose transferase-like glycosyltransferase